MDGYFVHFYVFFLLVPGEIPRSLTRQRAAGDFLALQSPRGGWQPCSASSCLLLEEVQRAFHLLLQMRVFPAEDFISSCMVPG